MIGFSYLFILLLAAAIVCVILAVGALRGHPPAGPSELMVCGKCQYPVRGISTFQCPECGADLREVGIVPPGTRKSSAGARASLLITWTILMMVVGTIVSAKVLSYVPRATTTQIHLGFSPSSIAPSQIDLEVNMAGRAGIAFGTSSSSRMINGVFSGTVTLGAITPNSRPDKLQIRVTTPPTRAASKLEVDPATMGYRQEDLSGNVIEKKSGFDADALKRWLTSIGVTSSGPSLDQEVKELADTVANLAAGQGTINFSTLQAPRISSTSSIIISPWPARALGMFWLLLYTSGAWWIIRRWRRVVGAKAAAHA